ncbi:MULTISPECIES: YaiI/YqxD family protein [unclassified Paenibacillus]|uniref:YaiI/YqxD family protein n=1 Tax=unclassified Paenibacillus TaxID=185978 RepID=UPI002F404FF8
MCRQSPAIIVDADACPVKQEIISAAADFSVHVCMVASFDHRLADHAGVEIVQVDRSNQSADLYIVNRTRKGDIVVTQDFGLACIALAKGALVISPRGEEYTNDNIDYLMERRHVQAKIRRGGGRTKGPKPLMPEDRERFQQKLTKVLQNLQENSEI